MKLLISHCDNYVGRGDMFTKSGLYEEVLIAYDKVIELDPDYIFAWNNKADCL